MRALVHGRWWILVLGMVLAGAGCAGEREAEEETEPPEPYSPPAEGAPECELSADCPDGTFCDLGECIQECNVVDPCSGELVCHVRGRCAEDASGPADPPIDTDPRATITAADSTVFVSADDAAVLLAFDAEPADRTIRYRVDPRAAWLRIDEPRGEFEGALMVSLDLDRSRLAPGEHTAAVVLHTTEGNVTVTVVLEQSLTATYQGRLSYTSPRSLGSVPVRVELAQDGTTAARWASGSRPRSTRATAC